MSRVQIELARLSLVIVASTLLGTSSRAQDPIRRSLLASMEGTRRNRRLRSTQTLRSNGMRPRTSGGRSRSLAGASPPRRLGRSDLCLECRPARSEQSRRPWASRPGSTSRHPSIQRDRSGPAHRQGRLGTNGSRRAAARRNTTRITARGHRARRSRTASAFTRGSSPRGCKSYDMDGQAAMAEDLGDKQMRMQFGEETRPSCMGTAS